MLRQGLNYRVVSILVLVVVASFVFAPVALAEKSIDFDMDGDGIKERYVDEDPGDGIYVREDDGAEFELNSKNELVPRSSTGGTTPGGGLKQFINFTNPLTSTSLTGLLDSILKWLIKIGAVLAVAFMSFGGLKLITSKGEPGEISKAKDIISYAIYGLAFVLVASMLSSAIAGLLGTTTPENQEETTKLWDLVMKLFRYFYTLVFTISIILFARGGLYFLQAQGDPVKISTARKNTLYGILGIAVILGVWFIVTLLANVLGVSVPAYPF